MVVLAECSAVAPLAELLEVVVEVLVDAPTMHVKKGDQCGPVVWDLQWQEHPQWYHTDNPPVCTAS